MRLARPALAASILLALAGPAAWAQNLVTNAHFDTNVNSWTPWLINGGLLAWSPLDWAGNPSSGSGLMTNDSSFSGTRFYRVSNCITAPTTGTYEYGAHIRIPGGQTTGGSAAVSLVLWDLPGCSGNSGGGINPAAIVSTATTDVWVPILIQGLSLNAGRSVQLALSVMKSQAGGTLSVHFDFARFGLDGTTPVELLELEIE